MTFTLVECLLAGFILGFLIPTFAVALFALNKAISAELRAGAIEKSTHSMYPVQVGQETTGAVKKFEEDLKNLGLNGLQNEDFTSDLVRNGFDPANIDVEDQV